MSFETFWSMYPRKIAKGAALKAWLKLTPLDQQLAIDALPNHVKHWELKQTEKDYICYPATWLNGWRWLDEIDLTPKKENKRPPLPWYASDELTLAKGRELGLNPYAGETFAQFRARLSAKIGSVGVET